MATPPVAPQVAQISLTANHHPSTANIGATLQTTEESGPLSPPQMLSVLDTTTRTGSLRARERNETRDEIPRIPTGDSLHAQQSEPSTHEIAEGASPPGERRHDQN